MKVGKIYFAYVNPATAFNPAIHNVEDEKVFALTISQSEGEFAQAQCDIQNPGQGLLNPARKQNVFISAEIEGVVTLIFKGRLVGFPEDPIDQIITLRIIAQPEDWAATQLAFIQTLKVAPYFNVLFTPEEQRDDPAEILAARAALFHWDRVTGALSLSDIVEGSTLVDIGDSFVFDSLELRIGDPPLAGVDLVLEVQWNQLGVGQVNVGAAITEQFDNDITTSPVINTLTPIGLEKGWTGARIPTGYEVTESRLNPIANGFGLTQANLRSGLATVSGADYPTSNGQTPATRQVSVPRVWYLGRLVCQANYEQKRRETVSANVNVSAQALSLANDARELISIRLQDPTAESQGAVLDIGKPSFFLEGGALSTYGEEAVQHGLLRCHARLLKATRVIETSIVVRLEDCITMTCDKSVRIEDDRIPGGSMRGKVISYSFTIDGQSGQNNGQITFASVLGTGIDSAGPGAEVGEETYDNEVGTPTVISALFYELDGVFAPPEPIDVAMMESDDSYLIDGVIVDNTGSEQDDAFVDQAQPDVYLSAHGTNITINLKSMNPEPELLNEIALTVSDLTLPNHMDLSA